MSAGRARWWPAARVAAVFARCAMLLPLLAMLLLAGPAQAQGTATRGYGDFDHLRTGYALTGAHATARCESCHAGGRFQGTPRDCESCHVAGGRNAQGNVVKPAAHFPVTQSCDSCHNTRTFSGARMNHGMVARGSCSSCHNGQSASGKHPGHLRTTASCDSCHSPNGWRPVRAFDHAGVAPGSCETCHNGGAATGRPPGHPPYQTVAAGAGATCDTCHRSGFRSWLPARVHGNLSISAQCGSCHAANRPATAVHVGQTVCENCHRSTATWSGARVDHATFTVATNCSSCHNGTGASGKPAAHIPSGAVNCIACHRTTTWLPSTFNHTQLPVTGQCAGCHSGSFPPADGKPATHVPYQLVATLAAANCDTCHRGGFASWGGARVHASASVTGQCKACHNGSYASAGASGKPNNHIPEAQLLNGAAMDCSACHRSTGSWTVAMDHNGSLGGGAGWCKACHQSGTSYAGGMERKSLTHRTKTPPAVDCSESGCHRPLGNKGTTYRNWD